MLKLCQISKIGVELISFNLMSHLKKQKPQLRGQNSLRIKQIC